MKNQSLQQPNKNLNKNFSIETRDLIELSQEINEKLESSKLKIEDQPLLNNLWREAQELTEIFNRSSGKSPIFRLLPILLTKTYRKIESEIENKPTLRDENEINALINSLRSWDERAQNLLSDESERELEPNLTSRARMGNQRRELSPLLEQIKRSGILEIILREENKLERELRVNERIERIHREEERLEIVQRELELREREARLQERRERYFRQEERLERQHREEERLEREFRDQERLEREKRQEVLDERRIHEENHIIRLIREERLIERHRREEEILARRIRHEERLEKLQDILGISQIQNRRERLQANLPREERHSPADEIEKEIAGI